jgi:hypothetical protein
MMNYKIVECFQTYDGKLFTNEKEAKQHSDDILGEELDGLLKLAKLDITRNQEYKALLAWMEDKDKLRVTIDKLQRILNHGED